MMTAAPPGPYASYCASSYDTPGSSPVPRRIARLMFSAGMFAALASAMIVRSRGFMSGSPPPARAATVNSLMMRVKILPRLASRAPFLCLIDAHFEWPDMVEAPDGKPPRNPRQINEMERKILHLFRQEDPDIGARVPGLTAVVAQHGFHAESGPFEPPPHLRDGQRAERQLEAVLRRAAPAAFDVSLIERREAAPRVLPDRFDERQAARRRATGLRAGRGSRIRASWERPEPGRCRTFRRAGARAPPIRGWLSDRARG